MSFLTSMYKTYIIQNVHSCAGVEVRDDDLDDAHSAVHQERGQLLDAMLVHLQVGYTILLSDFTTCMLTHSA